MVRTANLVRHGQKGVMRRKHSRYQYQMIVRLERLSQPFKHCPRCVRATTSYSQNSNSSQIRQAFRQTSIHHSARIVTPSRQHIIFTLCHSRLHSSSKYKYGVHGNPGASTLVLLILAVTHSKETIDCQSLTLRHCYETTDSLHVCRPTPRSTLVHQRWK